MEEPNGSHFSSFLKYLERSVDFEENFLTSCLIFGGESVLEKVLECVVVSDLEEVGEVGFAALLIVHWILIKLRMLSNSHEFTRSKSALLSRKQLPPSVQTPLPPSGVRSSLKFCDAFLKFETQKKRRPSRSKSASKRKAGVTTNEEEKEFRVVPRIWDKLGRRISYSRQSHDHAISKQAMLGLTQSNRKLCDLAHNIEQPLHSLKTKKSLATQNFQIEGEAP